MKEGSPAAFNNIFVKIGVIWDAYELPKKGNNKIGAYVEANNHILKSHATSAKIDKATPETNQLFMLLNESALQFANVVRPKVN